MFGINAVAQGCPDRGNSEVHDAEMRDSGQTLRGR